jgi:hypothetical protein
MSSGKKAIAIIIGIGVVLLQLIMTQLVTFLVSLLIPGIEAFQKAYPVFFAIIVGATFSVGIYLAGWLALKWRWLKLEPKYTARLLGTLLGVYLPLIIALILYPSIEAGNPFLGISMIAGILGFYVAGWVRK